MADASQGPNYWSIGDTKQVHLSGTTGGVTWDNDYWVYIIGFDHNKDKEGIGIAFQGFKTAQSGGIDIALVGNTYASTSGGFQMNTSNTSSGGWNGSYAYKTQCPQIKACLTSDLQAVIRTTMLYTDNVGSGTTSTANVTANSNEIYYLSEFEVSSNIAYGNGGEALYQVPYAYYTAGNSKVKYRSDSTGTAAVWWLRSPGRNYSSAFCAVNTSGSAIGNGRPDAASAVAPAFKV